MRVGWMSSSPRLRPSSATRRSSDHPAASSKTCLTSEYPFACKPLDAIASADSGRSQQERLVDDPGRGACKIVLINAEQAGMLGGLASDEGAAGDLAGLSDALDDRRDPLGDELAAGDVVGHEKRFSTADHEVVHDHADQVEAD